MGSRVVDQDRNATNARTKKIVSSVATVSLPMIAIAHPLPQIFSRLKTLPKRLRMQQAGLKGLLLCPDGRYSRDSVMR